MVYIKMKQLIALGYLVMHPLRTLKIINLYRLLKPKYRLTIIFAHAYKEALYQRKEKTFSKGNYDKEQKLQDLQLIINIHNGMLHSGGLTDRLKGMCTLYSYSKKHNFRFRISFTHPFLLEKYLVPNEYDWGISPKEISYNLKTTAVYIWENEALVSDFFKNNKNKQQLHVDCNSAECWAQYSELFHQLFMPSQYLKEQLNPHLEKLGGAKKFVTISFRFQNLLGEFKEAESSALHKNEQEYLIEICLKAINDIKNHNKDIDKILITSDSNIFRTLAIKKFPFAYTYIFPKEIGHIDHAEPGKSKELTAFLDMFLISEAKKAYQVRSAQMYNSDFPKMGARINNVPYEMIEIK